MLFEYGRRVEGTRVAVVEEESVPGMIYELNCDIRIEDSTKLTVENVEKVKRELRDRFNAELIYLGVDHDKAVIQVKGSPFSWGAFLAALPAILRIIGLVLFGVSIVAIIKTIPTWQLILFILALMLVLGLVERVINIVKAVKEEGD